MICIKIIFLHALQFCIKITGMQIATQQLLKELSLQVAQHKSIVAHCLQLKDAELNFKTSASGWSILECIEHLNRYGNFYLPEISKRLNRNTTYPEAVFKSGWLGNYFAQSMLPGKNMKPMKAFDAMNPCGSLLDKEVLYTFIRQQDQLLELLNRTAQISLIRTRTAISISRLLTLRLGDTLRFVIYHNHRHILQAQRLCS